MRDEKLKVIRALDPVAPHHIVRGQYEAKRQDGPSYREAVEDPRSRTESFVAMKVHISNWRWAGTPFYLRTGKRLAARSSEISVVFKELPHSIFGEKPDHRNILSIRLQPNEGITLSVTIKEPGPGGMRLIDVPLDMTFAEALGEDAEERRRLRAADHGCDPRQPDPVHARRRGRGGMGLDRSDHRRLGGARRSAQAL